MKKIIYLVIIVFAVGAFSSCKEGDDIYKEFIVPNGLVYPQKADLLRAYSGINRVKLEWIAPVDPKVHSAKVFWHNYTDSLSVTLPADPTEQTWVSVFIDNLKEGAYTFYVKTYDDKGNASIASSVTGTVFSPDNGFLLEPQPILSSKVNEAEQWFIQFGTLNGVLGSEIEYLATDGLTKTVLAKSVEGMKRIDDAVLDSKFKYRTLYFDEYSYLDTIYTSYYEAEVPFLRKPYPSGLPHEPGIVEFEDFDMGGEGIAYHDSDAANTQGGRYRTDPADQGVDLQSGGNYSNGFIIGADPTEWVSYTINAPVGGDYSFAYWALTGSESAFDLLIDGQLAVQVIVSNSGWAVTKRDAVNITLSAGTHVLTIKFNGGGGYDKFEFQPI